MAEPKVPQTSSSPSLTTTNSNDAFLSSAGYLPVLPRRRFTPLSLLALNFDLTCTWLGMATSLGIALTEASSAGVIWSLLIAGVFTAILAIGMSELASSYPVAGGKYYWAFMVIKEERRNFAAFVTGWGSVCTLMSGMILAIAVFNHYPAYEIQRWHQYLVYVGVVWLAIAWNTYGARFIPLYNKCLLFLSIVVVVVTFLTLLICSRGQYPSAGWIFGDTTNSSGWDSNGFAFVLCVMNGVFAYAGIDASTHLAEEIPSPSKNVPRCVLWSILLGFIIAWPLAVCFMASIKDLEAVLASPTGFPLIEVFHQGTGTRGAATFFMVLFTFCFFSCAVANVTSSSRTLWAVSRDNALPYSHIWAKVHPSLKVPANAMYLSGIVVTLYGLIFLGSANVFSSMISSTLIFNQTSIGIPLSIVLWRRRTKVLPARFFDVPEPWGTLINIIALSWVTFVDVLGCMPITYPVTLENMNWISVVVVGVWTFILGLWVVSKRKVFKGPNVDMELMKRRREVALGLVGDNGLGHEKVVSDGKV